MMVVIRGTVQYIDGLKVAITSVNEYFTGNFVGGEGELRWHVSFCSTVTAHSTFY